MSEIRLGSINGSHGIKGWVKVFSYTDPIEAILEYSPWILRKNGKVLEVDVQGGQVNGRKLIAQLVGIETRDSADDLIGYEVHVSNELLPELEQGEFYWFQLEGLQVRNIDGAVLGQVDHLIETGANDVIVVEPNNDSVDDRQRLIPYVMDEVVRQVDRDSGTILVAWEVDY